MTAKISEKENAIRLLVVDDHSVVREGLTAIIDRQPDMQVIAEAANGQQAVEMFRRRAPDVTLMDLRMPLMNGVETIIALRKEFPGSRFIVLTTYDGDEDIFRALQAGAVGYLLKDVFRGELLEAIRAVHAGRRCIPTGVANRLAERMAGNNLTAREVEVLQLIALGKSNREIGRASCRERVYDDV